MHRAPLKTLFLPSKQCYGAGTYDDIVARRDMRCVTTGTAIYRPYRWGISLKQPL